MASIESFLQHIAGLLNSDTPAEGIVISLALMLLAYFLFRFVLSLFESHARRHELRLERSRTTGEARFEKETHHLERLSEALAQLVTLTSSLSRESGVAARFQWQKVHAASIACLGASAPFLNFTSERNGDPTCGVIELPNSVLEGCNRDCTACEKGINEFVCNIERDGLMSLYLRAAVLIDRCAQEARGSLGVDAGRILDPRVIDRAKDGNIAEWDIHKSYQYFINCAYCRIRNCEQGTREKRWGRFKSWLVGWLKWLFAAPYHYFDTKCRYEQYAKVTRRDLGREWARFIIFAAFAIAVIAGALWFYPLPSFFDLSNHLGFFCFVFVLVIVCGIAMAINEFRGKRHD